MHDQGKRCRLELVSVLDNICHQITETCVDWGGWFLSHCYLLVGSHEFLRTRSRFWRCWKQLCVVLSFIFSCLVRDSLDRSGRLTALALDSEPT